MSPPHLDGTSSPCPRHRVTSPQGKPPSRSNVAARRLDAEIRPNAWYKKIDSALRGHPGTEIGVLVGLTAASRVLVAPALPSEGRVVRSGQVFIDGCPLDTTRLGAGSATSSVVERLGIEAQRAVELIDLATVRGPRAELHARLATGPPALLVADSETEADLAAARGGVDAGPGAALLWFGWSGPAPGRAGGPTKHDTVDPSSDPAHAYRRRQPA